MLHRRYAVPAALALLAAAGCDQPSTAPTTTDGPRLGRSAGPIAGTIVGVDIGVLPGDVSSQATHVTEDGVVYGYSYPEAGDGWDWTDDPAAIPGARPFRWTASTGMQVVSSIPAPPAYPIPPITPPAGTAVDARAANAKGEVTGQLCRDGSCGSGYGPDASAHVFRWSSGAGVQNLEPGRANPADDPDRSVGWAINRWGHVAGNRITAAAGDIRPFFWAPVDTFVTLDGPGVGSERRVILNDHDQVAWWKQNLGADGYAFVWRPDLGARELTSPSCATYRGAVPMAQNNATRVVGWGWVDGPDENCRKHAVVWTVPAVNRAGYPGVNASPITFASTISLATTGGRYYQFYKATQASASGPYVELVDWGDGTTSSRTSTSIGTTTSQNHVYTRTGTFWVRVYVKDKLGRWGVGERKLTVTP